MEIDDTLIDAVSQGKLPRLALIVAIMILRHPREVYKVNDIAEWCGIARRTTFLMLSHLRNDYFEIIQTQNGIKIIQIKPKQNSAVECTDGGTPLHDDYPSLKAMDWAKQRYPQINVTAAASSFRAHHVFKKTKRISWEAAWRSWMARAHKDPETNETRTTKFHSAVDIALGSNPFTPR